MNQQRSGGNAVNMFTGVKVFSATMAHDREILGAKVMAWIQKNPSRQNRPDGCHPVFGPSVSLPGDHGLRPAARTSKACALPGGRARERVQDRQCVSLRAGAATATDGPGSAPTGPRRGSRGVGGTSIGRPRTASWTSSVRNPKRWSPANAGIPAGASWSRTCSPDLQTTSPRSPPAPSRVSSDSRPNGVHVHEADQVRDPIVTRGGDRAGARGLQLERPAAVARPRKRLRSARPIPGRRRCGESPASSTGGRSPI